MSSPDFDDDLGFNVPGELEELFILARHLEGMKAFMEKRKPQW